MILLVNLKQTRTVKGPSLFLFVQNIKREKILMKERLEGGQETKQKRNQNQIVRRELEEDWMSQFKIIVL